jgi:uncharacterized protein YndB with AHSA1/START domain
MKSVIKAIVFFLVGITVIFYGGAYMLPGEARVERSIDIAAPPERVFAIAGDLRHLPEWTPWVDMDPRTSFSFAGPEQGVGQTMRWASGNPMVGSGTLKVTLSEPNTRVATQSDYAGFGTSTASLTFLPQGSGTRVTWTFQSRLPGVIDRWAGLGIDGSVGAEYKKGLPKFKALVEKP